MYKTINLGFKQIVQLLHEKINNTHKKFLIELINQNDLIFLFEG